MLFIPRGFRASAVHCGIKKASTREDIALFVADEPSVGAGCYTQNLVVAAPVILDRERTPADNLQAIVVNSGNANACTGPQGMLDARQMAKQTASLCGLSEEQVLVMSTGIIGEPLPMPAISRGISAAAAQLATDEKAWQAASRGLLTTDTCNKIRSTRFPLGGPEVTILGIAKGSGMIGPRMATMLAVILTDVRLSPTSAQAALARGVEQSFNSISVDGHTSTNDTVLLLASGAASTAELEGSDLAEFERQLRSILTQLALAIVEDGEGATHLIQIDVSGAASASDAKRIAETIAASPLVKTAVAGGDPNWGRIVSAAGYAGVPVDVARLTLRVNDFLLFDNGVPQSFDRQAASNSIRQNRQTLIALTVGDGNGQATFWTCDLTKDYVTINADYHT
jgi:glutamate N-acetyltransferase/amino-acid N-acetyltransferase